MSDDCPYCDGGVLEPMDGYPHTRQCSNLGECPATFVAVLEGGDA